MSKAIQKSGAIVDPMFGLSEEVLSFVRQASEQVLTNGTTKEKLAFFGIAAALTSSLFAMRLGYSFEGDILNGTFSFKPPATTKAQR